jgi:hypothetical protein
MYLVKYRKLLELTEDYIDALNAERVLEDENSEFIDYRLLYDDLKISD